MIVLMDMEWVENKMRHVTPTQLAAIRVDEAWETVSMFSSLCRPRDESFYQWNHVAFAGAAQQDFLYAPQAKRVFERFLGWLEPDDVLLWWSQDAARHFVGLLKILVYSKLKNKNYSIQPAFQAFVNDGRKTRGSIYTLAKMRNIPLLAPEHFAENDARMMQMLLQKVGFQLEYLHQQIPPKEARKAFHAANNSAYQFLIDRNTNLIHMKGCDLLPGDANVTGYRDIASAAKHHAAPCQACCKQLWLKHIAKRNRAAMQKSFSNYFFLPNGRAFHRPTCHMVLHAAIPPNGTVYFETALKSGRTPCKICCPDPSSEPTPEKIKHRKQVVTTEQRLTGTEQQAMKRFQQASRERARLDLLSMTEQQRTDSITLTATRYAFWAVPGYSTFHTRNCVKLNGMTGIRGFARYNEAIKAGFQPCRHCRPSPKQDAVLSIPINNQARESERIQDIIALCKAKGYKCAWDRKELLIETPVGRWLIDIEKRPIFVEHQHIGENAEGEAEIHWQPRMFLSLHDVVEYIDKHDSAIMLRTMST